MNRDDGRIVEHFGHAYMWTVTDGRLSLVRFERAIEQVRRVTALAAEALRGISDHTPRQEAWDL